jgi:carbonic anhydrase/acetyltransferase-like protein (isoleucine patch superfamily)
MRVVVLETGRILSPFGDAVTLAAVGLGTLGTHQADLAAMLGGKLVKAASLQDVPASTEPTWVLRDHTFLSRRLVRAVVGLKLDTPMRVGLPTSRFTQLYAQHQDVAVNADGTHAYDAWWFPPGAPAGWPVLESIPVRAVPFRERVLSFATPPNIMGRAVHEHPLTTTVAMHVKHWVHVLWLGNLWPQIEQVERITQNPLGTAWRLLRSVRPSVQGTQWALARNFNRVGRKVSIHPTACVELSILGDGVSVGPFALVRGAVLGRDVRVEERANVMFSVLGDRAFVSKNSTVFSCVGYPDADLCINGMQYCVAGRHSALTSLVRPMDMKYRDDVTVRMDGKNVAIKELMVGSCFGHHSFVGPDVLIGPGREIPNHTVVAPRPGAVLTRVDPQVAEKGGTAFVQDGVLVPLGRSSGS